MPVGILVITHGQIGHSLVEAARDTLGIRPIPLEILAVAPENTATEQLTLEAETFYKQLDSGSGVLILSDIFGATPANIASSLLHHPQTLMITGINLPMVIRLMNYSDLPLAQLAEKAMTGGHEGTFMIQEEIDD